MHRRDLAYSRLSTDGEVLLRECWDVLLFSPGLQCDQCPSVGGVRLASGRRQSLAWGLRELTEGRISAHLRMSTRDGVVGWQKPA